MSDRLAAALAELVAAIRDEISSSMPAPADGPVELLSPKRFAELSGLGRSTVYLGIADGTIRSVKVRGRRLVASSELGRIAAAAAPAVSRGTRQQRARQGAS